MSNNKMVNIKNMFGTRSPINKMTPEEVAQQMEFIEAYKRFKEAGRQKEYIEVYKKQKETENKLAQLKLYNMVLEEECLQSVEEQRRQPRQPRRPRVSMNTMWARLARS